MRTLLLSLLVLTSTACKKKEAKPDEAPAPAALPTAGNATTPPPATPPPAAAAAKLNCDKVLPQALRDKYFAGMTINDNPQPVPHAGECKVVAADKSEVGTVTVSCMDMLPPKAVEDSMKMSLDALKSGLHGTDLPGVGKGAVLVDMKEMGRQVAAWDDDSKCDIHFMVPTTVDHVAFAKDLLATLPLK